MFTYRGHTPGVQLGDNTTVLLGSDSEPQPDLFLRILPEYGGQSQTTEDDYVLGAPELVAEIAHSSRSIDLYKKREKYRQFGVREYLVLSLDEKRLRWFDLTEDKELLAGDGIVRAKNFPGLWTDAAALFADDYGRLMSAVNQGIASPEHAQFVERLANKKASNAT
jgi:Uma2 family endonuclease